MDRGAGIVVPIACPHFDVKVAALLDAIVDVRSAVGVLSLEVRPLLEHQVWTLLRYPIEPATEGAILESDRNTSSNCGCATLSRQSNFGESGGRGLRAPIGNARVACNTPGGSACCYWSSGQWKVGHPGE